MTPHATIHPPIIAVPGPWRWNCIETAPGREQSVMRAMREMRDRGRLDVADMFRVSEMVKCQTIRRDWIERERMLLTRMVFCLFPGVIDIYALKDRCRHVTGILLTTAGRVAVLDASDLTTLHALSVRAQEARENARQRKIKAGSLRRGDKVYLPGLTSALASGPVEVRDFRNGEATITVRMFGSEYEAKASADRLVKAE